MRDIALLMDFAFYTLLQSFAVRSIADALFT